MELNNWSTAEVKRAESTWGQKVPPYSKAMFDFAIEGCKSWLDLGCGFGRFLNYLINYTFTKDILESKETNEIDDPDYIGYDSSKDMISRISERFPVYSSRAFHRDITLPINNHQESIICSAVLIHLPKADQLKIFKNVKESNPKKFAFDINSPEESKISENPYFENSVKGSEGIFRMTWQSHYDMTKLVLATFPKYKLTNQYYVVNKVRKKVLYMLERAGN